jgi:Secretion system C-terminal sorting domain
MMKVMRKLYIIVLLVVIPFFVKAQKVTTGSGGNWVDGTSWVLSVPASGPTDDVTMASGAALTVRNIDNVVSGAIDAGTNNTLTVNGDVSNTGHLDVGDSPNFPTDVTAGNSMAIVANDGVIIIWGNLIVNNSLAVTIQGPNGAIIIKGNVTLANNASFTVNGDLEVDGNFIGGTSTNVIVSGNVFVYGTTSVGPSSNVIDAGGHFHTYGGCSGPPSFCSTTPVELISFNAEPKQQSVAFSWSTASELNADYFILERSRNAEKFEKIAVIPAHGTSRVQNDYFVEDEKPVLGKAYYRLTEVDINKSVERLKVLEVNFTGSKALTVYPNPVTEKRVNFELNFNPETQPESPVFVSVVDMRGMTLSEFVMDKREATLNAELPSGVYIVMLRSKEFSSKTKLLVR